MHIPGEPRTEPTSLVASEVYRLKMNSRPPAEFHTALPADEFRKQVDAEIAARAGSIIPFGAPVPGTPPCKTCASSWNTSGPLLQLLQPAGQLAFRFETIETRRCFYRNLYGEAGRGDTGASHPAMLAHLHGVFRYSAGD